MSEFTPNTIDRLDLSDLKKGDVIEITLGSGSEAFKYSFTVETQARWPIGFLEEVSPDGTINNGQFCLHGSGRWTTKKENPVQDQQLAFTSYFDSLNVGSFMVGAAPEAHTSERLVFDKPGQEITQIKLR